MLACQAGGFAVAGIWPLVFTKAGYKGTLAWATDFACCVGKEAYSHLLEGQDVE